MELWRQCAGWLIQCRVLPDNHRVTWDSAQVSVYLRTTLQTADNHWDTRLKTLHTVLMSSLQTGTAFKGTVLSKIKKKHSSFIHPQVVPKLCVCVVCVFIYVCVCVLSTKQDHLKNVGNQTVSGSH